MEPGSKRSISSFLENNVAKITTLRTEVKDQSLLSLIGLRVGWVTPMGGNLEKSGMVNRQASFLLSLILRWPFHDAATGIFQSDRQGAASSFYKS